jgi:hypothetical protein
MPLRPRIVSGTEETLEAHVYAVVAVVVAIVRLIVRGRRGPRDVVF